MQYVRGQQNELFYLQNGTELTKQTLKNIGSDTESPLIDHQEKLRQGSILNRITQLKELKQSRYTPPHKLKNTQELSFQAFREEFQNSFDQGGEVAPAQACFAQPSILDASSPAIRYEEMEQVLNSSLQNTFFSPTVQQFAEEFAMGGKGDRSNSLQRGIQCFAVPNAISIGGDNSCSFVQMDDSHAPSNKHYFESVRFGAENNQSNHVLDRNAQYQQGAVDKENSDSRDQAIKNRKNSFVRAENSLKQKVLEKVLRTIDNTPNMQSQATRNDQQRDQRSNSLGKKLRIEDRLINHGKQQHLRLHKLRLERETGGLVANMDARTGQRFTPEINEESQRMQRSVSDLIKWQENRSHKNEAARHCKLKQEIQTIIQGQGTKVNETPLLKKSFSNVQQCISLISVRNKHTKRRDNIAGNKRARNVTTNLPPSSPAKVLQYGPQQQTPKEIYINYESPNSLVVQQKNTCNRLAKNDQQAPNVMSAKIFVQNAPRDRGLLPTKSVPDKINNNNNNNNGSNSGIINVGTYLKCNLTGVAPQEHQTHMDTSRFGGAMLQHQQAEKAEAVPPRMQRSLSQKIPKASQTSLLKSIEMRRQKIFAKNEENYLIIDSEQVKEQDAQELSHFFNQKRLKIVEQPNFFAGGAQSAQNLLSANNSNDVSLLKLTMQERSELWISQKQHKKYLQQCSQEEREVQGCTFKPQIASRNTSRITTPRTEYSRQTCQRDTPQSIHNYSSYQNQQQQGPTLTKAQLQHNSKSSSYSNKHIYKKQLFEGQLVQKHSPSKLNTNSLQCYSQRALPSDRTLINDIRSERTALPDRR